MFNKIAIIGVGLIGGSIGLAARKKRLARKIIGVCRHRDSLQKARQRGAIDLGTLNYKEAVQDAELVILASPVVQIIKMAELVMPYLQKGCLLTDVGSSKEEIVRSIENILPAHIYFVGVHPLAGSEQRGVTKAREDLFRGATCILTRTKKTNLPALKKISTFWKKMGCQIKILTPQRHDKIVALTSHLPHLAATQLVKTAKGNLDFAASGFLDTTRIASSHAEIWIDIFLTNKRHIVKAVDEYIKQLRLMRDLIVKEDIRKINIEFKRAKALRDAFRR
jgi:prephenate dehydrogenase